VAHKKGETYLLLISIIIESLQNSNLSKKYIYEAGLLCELCASCETYPCISWLYGWTARNEALESAASVTAC